MISKKLEKAINDQIKLEEESSRIYLAMASWCQTKGFPGAAAFLYKHSDEERIHQLRFVHYLNDRNGFAVLSDVEKTKNEYGSIENLFEEVLKHEQMVTGRINMLVDLCLEEKDHTTNNFLQWFVTEQIEEESLVQGIIDKFRLIGGSAGGYFHIDNYLGGLATANTANEQA